MYIFGVHLTRFRNSSFKIDKQTKSLTAETKELIALFKSSSWQGFNIIVAYVKIGEINKVSNFFWEVAFSSLNSGSEIWEYIRRRLSNQILNH